MDIYHFIDSRDIREHLRGLNYRLGTAEATFLVRHCKNAAQGEKFAA